MPITPPGVSGPVETVLAFPPGVELVTDTAPAEWVERALSPRPFATVGALVPDGFEAYARVLHPAYLVHGGSELEPVTWAAVAAEIGAKVHPLMQFARLAGLDDDPNSQPEWGQRPEEGSLPAEVADPLVRILKEFTTSVHCYFCLWDGFGGLDLIPNLYTLPRVRAPGRDYLLFHGRIDAILAWQDDRESASTDEPQLWWPEDRSWCVATDIDLDSTYVGGSRGCILDLIAAPELEVVPARIEDRVVVGPTL